MLRPEHDLAEDLALLDQAERLVHLGQRLVDDGLELAPADEVEERGEVSRMKLFDPSTWISNDQT